MLLCFAASLTTIGDFFLETTFPLTILFKLLRTVILVIGLSSLVKLLDAFLEPKFEVRDFERIHSWFLVATVFLTDRDRLLYSESIVLFLVKFDGTPLDSRAFLDSRLLALL